MTQPSKAEAMVDDGRMLESGSTDELGKPSSVQFRKKSRLERIVCYRWWTAVLSIFLCTLVLLGVAAGIVYSQKPWVKDEPDFSLSSDRADGDIFVPVEWLVERMASPAGVTVLDARSPPSSFSTQPGLGKSIPGAIRATWQDFVEGDELADVPRLQEIFREKGVYNDRPVLVYGGWSAADYWGEEGRIFWQLDWLNHTDVHLLYGGVWAWDDAVHVGSGLAGQGDFVASPVPNRRTDADDIVRAISEEPDNIFIVDARTEDEFNGASPYGSDFGGHIDGAKAFHWKQLFDQGGNMHPVEEIRDRLTSLGFRDGMNVVTYCTRGVRAGFMYAALKWAGFQTANYPGSWRDWASRNPQKK